MSSRVFSWVVSPSICQICSRETNSRAEPAHRTLGVLAATCSLCQTSLRSASEHQLWCEWLFSASEDLSSRSALHRVGHSLLRNCSRTEIFALDGEDVVCFGAWMGFYSFYLHQIHSLTMWWSRKGPVLWGRMWKSTSCERHSTQLCSGRANF